MAGGKPSRPKSALKKKTSKDGSARKQASKKTRAGPGLAGIVGIGASAGGLEALQGLIGNLPDDSGLAFVVSQHLPQGHKSVMGTLLSRLTTMPIEEIGDGLKAAPNHVYLHPADYELNILGGTFHLTAAEDPHSSRLPIDHFFRSLAEDQRERAVCIILSGTGTDGTLGLKAVKGEGGLTIVQEEKQAHYAGMPHSAISTGMVDLVLPVEKIGRELGKFIRHPLIAAREGAVTPPKQFESHIQQIFIAIRSRTGKDFSNYKPNTTRRRIERRMAVHQIDDAAVYLRYLKEHPGEIEKLAQDMLIGVTGFFRDPEAYDVLKEKVLLPLVRGKAPDGSIRVWVPGCSSGEEAYSIAMLLQEAMESERKTLNVQIFASDIDARAVDSARTGKYPESVIADVSAERLRAFFTRTDDVYTITKRIRDMVIFAEQDLVKDPPFSHLDLVSCRNLMIYFNANLQKKIIPLFHYVLNQDGALLLGTSESIGGFANYFTAVSQKWKIFRRKAAVTRPAGEYMEPPYMLDSATRAKQPVEAMPAGEKDIREIAERIILADFAPPCVLVNEHYKIVYFHGNTKPYLSPPVGKASFDLLKMAHEDLRLKLAPMLHKSLKSRKIVTESLTIQNMGRPRHLRLQVRPLEGPDNVSGLTMVVFEGEENKRKAPAGKAVRGDAAQDNRRIAIMEEDLQSMREYLQSTIEELETSNEELRSTNEELQSANEELQSTNEELETSREELQSTNEELETVNAELQGKVVELSRSNNDLANILVSTEIATVFLDKRYAVTRFTPSSTHIFNLIQSDIGRPISDITSKARDLDIITPAEKVLQSLMPQESEISTVDGKAFRMRVMPYRTLENIIDGVVITFIDVTDVKNMEATRRLATIVKDSNDAITVQDLDGTISAWNRGAERIYGYTEAEAIGMNISAFVPPGKKREALALIQRVKEGEVVHPLHTSRLTRDGRVVDVLLTVTKLTDDEGRISAIATTERDMTVHQSRRKGRKGE